MRLSSLIIMLALLASSPPRVDAQGTEGSIDGVARRAENDEPIAFALVRLLPADEQAAALRQTITGADGRWFFPRLAAGD